MQYSRLARAVSLTLPLALLAGCDDVLNDDVEEVTLQSQALKFDPANGMIPYPNDIVGFDEDGTLHVPGETDWANTDGDSPNVYWNYYGTQQGWGTSVPMILEFTKAPDEAGGSPTIDADTFQSGIKMFRENADGTLESLVWNEDYRAILAKAGTINIEPLKPFDEATRYFVALTSDVKDAHGQTLQTSSAYRQLLSSNDEMGQHLQGVIDQLGGAGLSDSSIIYAADFTTGSNVSVIRPVVAKYLETSDETILTIHQEITSTDTADVVNNNVLVNQFSETLKNEGVELPLPDNTEAGYHVFSASINLPAYMDTPDMNAGNCDYNQYVASMQNEDGSVPDGINFNEYRVAPQEFCPGAFSYFQADDGTPINAENAGNIHVFKTADQNSISALVFLPDGEVPEGGFPVIMSTHGFGGSKSDTELAAEQFTSEGYALVAIDHPMHGDRAVDIDGDGEKDLSATVRRTDYASPENLLTTRGFMWQVSLDYIGIRMAIANGVTDLQGKLLLDTNNVHMQGGSLGGIHSTIISGMIRDAQENIPGYKDELDLKTTTLNVPGAGVAAILMQSPVLQPEMKADILESAPFRLFMAEKLGLYNPVTQLSKDEKVTALDKTDEYREGLAGVDLTQPELISDENVRQLADKLLATSAAMGKSAPADFAEFEEQIWEAYKIPAEVAYQAITDPSDPVSYAKVLAQYPDEPILLNEAVGDGSNDLNILGLGIALATEGNEYNPGDFVIVNQADEMPLGGTDPLIRTLGLDLLVGGENGEKDVATVRGASRYGYGTHMSSFIPIPLALIDPDLLPNDMQVHNSIIGASTSFMNSKGSYVNVKNRGFTNGDDLLLLKEEFSEQPQYKLR
ncbi:hypothetical protein [Endozoicomonas arenosclerae]|uniref:hypothetical protein n=1 Tax=Endozoicomonas arenosclerae TaxID=1633495 RepID=UPI0007863CF9|nr:hypothetical protein [Endozoicomonas arenosclerae]